MTSAYGPLADRPNNPKVGLEVSHESAALHVTGTALYTGDLASGPGMRCTPGRSRPRTPTPGSPGSTPTRRTPSPAWSRC
jgi:hypothetical protein